MNLLLTCNKCQNSEKIHQIQPMMICSNCNEKLHLNHILNRKFIHNKKFKEEPPNVWKYLNNLPIKSKITLNEGGTPLRISSIGTKIGLDVKIKDETRNPTGSFLDRGTTLEISVLKEMNHNEPKSAIISELALSLSAYCASAKSQCVIFVPKGKESSLSQNRLHQLISYGAKIDFVLKNTSIPENYHHFKTNNTLFLEGLKTCGFEIADQLNWNLPNNIIIPFGNGTNLYALYQAIKELIHVGLIKKSQMPKIHGVTISTENGNNNSRLSLLDKDTIAPELSPESPSYFDEAMNAISESDGTLIKVTNNDLIHAVSILASNDGIFASTSGAASIAGLLSLEKRKIRKNQSFVCIVTGSGGLGEITPKQKIMVSQGITHDFKSKNKIEIKIGKTKQQILKLLKKEPDYAYNLKKRLENKSQKIDISTLYQHLNELESAFLITKTKAESFMGRPVRLYYSLTISGKKL